MADLNYIDSSYFTPDHGYFVYTADAASAQSVSTSMTASCGVIKQGATTLTSAFSPTVTCRAIRNDESLLLSSASLSAQASVIRATNITASSAFNIATDISRFRNYGSSEDAAFTISANNLRVRYEEAALSAAFSLSADATKIAGGQIVTGSGAFTSTATLSANVNVVRSGQVNVSSTASSSIVGSAVRNAASTENALFGSSINCSITVNSFAVLETQATVSAVITKNIGPIGAALSSAFTQNAQGKLIARGASAESAAFAQTVDADRLRGISSNLTITASIECKGRVKANFVSSALSASFTQTVSANRIRGVDSQQSVAVTLNSTALRIKQLSSTENALFTQTITCNAIRFNVAGLNTSVTQTIIGTVTRNLNSPLSSNFSESVLAKANKVAQGQFNSTVSLNAIVEKISRLTLTPTVYSGNGYTTLSTTATNAKFNQSLLNSGTINLRSSIGDRTGAVYGSAGFVALRPTSNTNPSNITSIISTDGINWSEYDTGISMTYSSDLQSYYSLKYINSKYTLLYDRQNSTTKIVYTSTDGINWSSTNLTISTSFKLYDITYANNQYIVSGTNSIGDGIIYTSSTLSGTWTNRYTTNVAQVDYPIVYLKASGTKVIAVGYYKDTGVTPNLYKPMLYFSTNSTTWTAKSFEVGTSTFKGFVSGDINPSNNVGVVVGTNGRIYMSEDGAFSTWTQVSSGTTVNLNSVSFINNKWIIEGENGLILNSTDYGYTWVSRYTPPTNNGIGYKNTLSQTSTQSPSTYGNGKYIVGRYTSTDSITWTPNLYGDLLRGYIEYPDNTKWNNWQTLDAWVNVDGYLNGVISHFDSTTGQIAFSLYMDNLYQVIFETYDGTTRRQKIANIGYNNAGWHHVRIVKNTSTTIQMYIDGILDTNGSSTMTVPSTWADLTTPLKINHSGVGYEEGTSVYSLIDEIRLYSTALIPTGVTTTEFVNDSNTSLLLHFNGSYADDNIIVLRNGAASLTSTATISALVGKFVASQSNQTATFTEVTNASKKVNISANLQVGASEVVAIGRIRPEVADLTSTATVTVSGKVTRNLVSNQAATFTQSATITKNIGPITANISATFTEVANIVLIRQGVANLQVQGFEVTIGVKKTNDTASLSSNFVLSATCDIVKVSSANFSSNFSTSITGTKTLGPITANLAATFTGTIHPNFISGELISLNAQFTQSITYRRYRSGSSFVNATASLSPNAVKKSVARSTLNSQFVETSSISVTRRTSIAQTVIASELVAVVKTGSGLIHAQSTATLTAAGKISTGSIIHASAAFTESATAKKTARAVSTQSSTFTLAINYRVFKDTPIAIHSQATLQAVARKSIVNNANLVSTASLSAQTKVIRSAIIIDLGTFTLSGQGKRLRGGNSAMSVNATIVASGVRTLKTNAALNITATLSATGSLFFLDADLTYKIPKELLEYVIETENLEYMIEYEERTYIIEGP